MESDLYSELYRIFVTIDTFRVNPKKTFFGLDKKKAHCFVLPKSTYADIIHEFGLSERSLGATATLEISGARYPVDVRWARQNRSRPYKHRPEDLPERDVVLLEWKKYPQTVSAIREAMLEAYDRISSGSKNDAQDMVFTYLGRSTLAFQATPVRL